MLFLYSGSFATGAGEWDTVGMRDVVLRNRCLTQRNTFVVLNKRIFFDLFQDDKNWAYILFVDESLK